MNTVDSEPAHRSAGGMLSGGTARPIFLFALPIMLGFFFQQLYITVDAVIVGRYLGSSSLAAVSVASPILFIVVFFLVGGCTGVSVLAAQIYGSGDRKRLKEAFATALTAGSVFTVILSAVCLASARSILVWTRAPLELHGETMAYLAIVFGGLIFSFLYNCLAAGLRGIGNSRAPFVFQAAASAGHIALNLLFVGALGMGVRGSAWATVLSQAGSSAACWIYICRRVPLLALSKRECVPAKWALSKILSYSWAAAMQSIIVYVGRFLTQGCVNPFGAEVIAGYNAATRIEGFVMMPFSGVSTAGATFCAQNIGAGHAERVKSGFRVSMMMNVAYSVPACIALWFAAPHVMTAFVPEGGGGAIIAAGVDYLRFMSLYYTIAAVDEVLQGFFRGIGDFRMTMYVSFAQIVVRVALSFALVPRVGVSGIAHATGIGWGLVFFWLSSCVRRRLKGICAPSGAE